MSTEKKAMLAAGAAYTIFGLSYLFSKMALDVTQPMILLFARFCVTLIVMNMLVLTKTVRLNLKGKKLMGPLLVGLFQPVLYFVFDRDPGSYMTGRVPPEAFDQWGMTGEAAIDAALENMERISPEAGFLCRTLLSRSDP